MFVAHARSHLARRLLAPALSLALALSVASVAGAQQAPQPRLVRAEVGHASAGERAVLVPRDSAAAYLRAARTQRWTGGSLITVALGTLAATYVQYARSSQMGMEGSQVGTFAVGAAVGVFGLTRWSASQKSMRAAARWTEIATASR